MIWIRLWCLREEQRRWQKVIWRGYGKEIVSQRWFDSFQEQGARLRGLQFREKDEKRVESHQKKKGEKPLGDLRQFRHTMLDIPKGNNGSQIRTPSLGALG